MPIGRILWGAASSGAHYENQLDVGYPLYDPVTDRPAREGSAWAQLPSGLEDAWITGRDFQLTAQVRFIPDSAGTPTRGVVAGPGACSSFWITHGTRTISGSCRT